MYVGIHESRPYKGELAWATDKWLRVIKTVIPLIKKLKNKAILSLNNIVSVAMWSLVLYSNCFVIYYQLMLRGSTIRVCFMFSSYTINNDHTFAMPGF